MITTTLSGERDIQFLLKNLDGFERDKAVKSGLRAGASVFRRKGRGNLRTRLQTPGGRTGNLLSAFAVRVKRRKAGALAGFTAKGHHAHLGTDAANTEGAKAMNEVREGIRRCVQRINERRKS